MKSEISTATREQNKPEISSPTATADHICRRLLRPSALLRSQPPPSSALASLGEKTMTKKKKKLEDYLDPALLAEISSKFSRAKKKMKDFNGVELNWRNVEDGVIDLRDNSNPLMFDQESCSTTQFQQFEEMASTIRAFPGK